MGPAGHFSSFVFLLGLFLYAVLIHIHIPKGSTTLGAYTSFLYLLTVSTWATPLDLLPVWYFHPTFNLLRVLFSFNADRHILAYGRGSERCKLTMIMEDRTY